MYFFHQSFCTGQLHSHLMDIHEIWHWRNFRKFVKPIKFSLNLTRMTGTIHEVQYKFFIYLAQFFLEREIFQTKVAEKIKTHVICSIIFFRHSCRLWDNVEKCCKAGQATDDNIIRRMRIACWIPKATNKHSQCVILIAFPLQQWLQKRASFLRYTFIACLVVK